MSIEIATKVAQANESYPKWPMGCVILKGGAVQAIGLNVWKGESLYLDNHSNCSIHCEVAALRQMRYRAKGCVMFVARIMRSGKVGLAKPCVNCQTVIEDAGIKRVIYTVNPHETGEWKP